MDTSAVTASQTRLRPDSEANGDAGFKAFGDDGFTFLDLVDMVNPLQHIPLISTLYRNLTGDTIDNVPRLVGGGLFFGPIGLASATVNVVLEESTGKDLGDHVVALISGDAPDEGEGAEGSVLAEGGGFADPALERPSAPMPEHGLSDEAAWELAAAGEPFADLTPPLNMAAFETAAGPRPVTSAPLAPPPGDDIDPDWVTPDSFEARAAAFYALEARRDTVRDQMAAYGAARQADHPGRAGPGAIGSGGGWFSETMLDALVRFQESRDQAILNRQTAAKAG
ncbi:MAG: hypothetical protein ACPGNT_00470 [Rhodospirillales bacterium]